MLKYYFFGLLVIFSGICTGQTKQSFFDIIQEDAKERIVMYANFDEMFSQKFKDIKAKGFIEFKDVSNKIKKLPIDIELRGKFRRVKCDFPPMKLSFKRKDAKFLTLDEKYRSIRLVSHCYIDENNTTDHLTREFLAYKMYNLISPNGYNVKKVQIEYRDSINDTSEIHDAILIEDNDQLSFRIGGYECEGLYNIDEKRFNQYNYTIVNAFQFMIANSDWSKDLLKNVKTLKRGDEFLLVPYDFDFSGLVRSKLAVPNNNMGLFRMKDRCWQGLDMESNQVIIDKFEPLESSFYELIRNDNSHSQESKDYMVDLIETFYQIIKNTPLESKKIYEYLNYNSER